MSSDREAEKAAFLAANGLGEAAREPLAGDASTRLYERLRTPSGASLIFMDQPPNAETEPCPPDASDGRARARWATTPWPAWPPAGSRRSSSVAGYLKERGFSAPEIVAADAPAGLAVLEDLGDDLYARLIEGGADEAELYDAATDALVRAARRAARRRC